MVLLFLAYTQLLRYLGAYSYGQFQFVLAYVTLFGVVIDFGIQQYIIKKISEDRSRAKQYFQNFFAVEIVLASTVYAVMVGIAYFNGYEPIVFKAIMIAGLGAALHGLTYPFLAVVTAFYDLKKAALLNFISSVINFTVIFVTIWLDGSILMLVVQQIIFAVIAILLYYQFVKKHIGNPEIIKGIRQLNWPLIKKIFRAALPFAMLVGFSTVYNRIDLILISKFLGYTQTGLYGAAYRVFDLLAFFPAVVSHSLYPLFSTLMIQKNIPEVRATLERYIRFMIAVALPMATGIMLLSEPIVRIFTGNDFASAADISQTARVLSVLVWAPAILFVYIVINALVISQLTKLAMFITGANVAVNIIGNIILLPRIGIMGAAIMTLISEMLQGLFYYYFVRTKITDFKLFAHAWQPFLASIVMGMAVWFTKTYFLPVPVLIGVVTYAGMLLIFGFFRKEDMGYMRTLFTRSNGNA